MKQVLLNLIDTSEFFPTPSTVETNNFAEKKYNSNYSILLNFAQFVMSFISLGVEEKLDIRNVQHSLVPRLIKYKSSDNKDDKVLRVLCLA